MTELMNALVNWLAAIFSALPLEFLEMWGRFGYIVGCALMVLAYGGFTFRLAGRWAFGREVQSWNAKALISMTLTSFLIISTGYIGSFIGLVAGAQTFESLKDCSVFLCIVLFGRPALLIAPIAYGISDLMEGVPPGFVLDWAIGYFINPSCFWLAYQLIGRNPDFRRAGTWGWFLVFVGVFMSIEPQLWGYICAEKFTPVISYREITPSLFFTTMITWIISPFAMLGALPLARKFGLFWAEVPGHIREKRIGSRDYVWESGRSPERQARAEAQPATLWLLLTIPFVLLILIITVSTAYIGFHSAQKSANKLVSQLHQELSENVNMLLDDYLRTSQASHDPSCADCIDKILRKLPIAEQGLVLAIDRTGRQVGTSLDESKPANNGAPKGASAVTPAVTDAALLQLRRVLGGLDTLKTNAQFSFAIVTAKPLGRENWLAQATAYSDLSGKIDWILVTALPESYYMGAIQDGNSRIAMFYAVMLILSLATTIFLSAVVVMPIRSISQAAQELAKDLSRRVKGNFLQELDSLSLSFNDMAAQLQESFKKAQWRDAIVASSEDAIIGRTLEGAVTSWNKGAEKIFGFSETEMQEKTIYAIIAPENMAREHEMIDAIRSGAAVKHFELKCLRKNGTRIDTSITLSPIRDEAGQLIGISKIARDITERKKVEQELAHYREHLEVLVAERTRELSSAKSLAESANRAKSTFLANMSHEIRTPMNVILGFTRVLRDDNLAPAQIDRLSKIDAAASHLLSIINNILDISKIEAGKVQLEQVNFNLGSVFDNVRSLVGELAEAKGLAIETHLDKVPRQLQGDPTRLQQALLNYVSNAIKFSERGVITLRASLEEDSGSTVRIRFEVQDQGIGIPADKISSLFQSFEQGDASTTRHYGGTGLGLAITRRLAELMGGESGAESEPGKGSRFWFTARLKRGQESLPDPAASGTVESAAAEMREKHRNARILLVEDYPLNQEIALVMLEKTGLSIDVAGNGLEALGMAQDTPYTLILMDMQMPVMDGLEATRIIRAIPQHAKTPILGMTANVFDDDRRRCLDAGMNDFIPKPIVQNVLYSILLKWLGKTKSH